MTEYAVTEVRRRLTPNQASGLVGDAVETREPNITAATVAIDADTREPVFAYLPIQARARVADLRRAVLAVQYTEGVQRQNGQRNKSRTFGYRPRRPVYGREGCGPTALTLDAPGPNAIVAGFADLLADMLADISPRLVDIGREAVAPVAEDWRLGESKLWTSGVINQSAVLPYHRDGFNFPAWSAMPVLRRHMDGGHLDIPEYGATIACRDGWAVFFPGYQLVHGVTPMRLRQPDGYRFSVVYYALKGMKDCFTYAVETAYAKRKRTEREQDMARRAKAGEKTIRQQGKGIPSDGRPQGSRIIAGTSDWDGRKTFRRDPRLSKKQSGRLIGGQSGRAFDADGPT